MPAGVSTIEIGGAHWLWKHGARYWLHRILFVDNRAYFLYIVIQIWTSGLLQEPALIIRQSNPTDDAIGLVDTAGGGQFAVNLRLLFDDDK